MDGEDRFSRSQRPPSRTADATAAYARAWLRADPDPSTRTQLLSLLSKGEEAELADHFNSRITFGTSGLRGPRGAGPNRMNRLLIAQATSAIMRHLRPSTVVIGFDARHGAREFADEAAAMVAEHGGLALVMPEALPTPVMAHAIRYYSADAGMIITASHNPMSDSGCKVFLGDGAQLVEPHDRQIEQLMAELADPPVHPHPGLGGQVSRVRNRVVDTYMDSIMAAGEDLRGLDLTVAYTPLHGVAGAIFVEAMERIGVGLTVVASQFEPDPDFPSVEFPNPEEPRSLDALVATAAGVDADVAFANDPDGDRLGVVIPDSGSWRQLNGDQIGVLLGDHCLRNTDGAGRLTAATAVSSRMLASISAAHDVEYVETMHGFKYVARAADDRMETRLIFGYEPALGYAVNDTIRDKDGISAAVAFLALVAELKSNGQTVLDRLDELAIEHGVHSTTQVVSWFNGLGARRRMQDFMSGVRADPPTEIGGRRVVELTDFEGQANMLRFDLADGSRVQLRPSGTEPKLKAYVELVSPVGAASQLVAVRASAEADRAELVAGVEELFARISDS